MTFPHVIQVIAPGAAVASLIARVATSAIPIAQADMIPVAVRLMTDTVVGAAVIIVVLLFQRRERERDAAVRAIADDFRKEVGEFRDDVRLIIKRVEVANRETAARWEATQDNQLQLSREMIQAVGGLNHTVQLLDQTVRTIGGRLDRVEHHVFISQGQAPATPPRILEGE